LEENEPSQEQKSVLLTPQKKRASFETPSDVPEGEHQSVQNKSFF
jgi:hypothetical protein